ncbi:DNA-binding protein inhibitor ID-3 isoform X1 [Anolis sagrei]|uniref:DNA-binding protein inhibitor ID-3 isoform X1 n=1 Tax=Anolis sagrei TaxID=38937 RepID=UPI00352022B1
MKAISPVRSVRSCLEAVCCLSEQSLGIARGSGLALGKACPSAEEPASLLDDMNGCYSKLRELVPGIPQGSQLSQVEILQHVIDYIFDLQIVLQEQAQEKKKSRSRKDTAGQPAALQAAGVGSWHLVLSSKREKERERR